MTLLPRKWALAFGRFLGLMGFYIFKKRRKLALDNLKQALGLEDENIIKKVYINLGLNLIEFLRFSEINKDNLSQFVTIHGREYLDKAYAEKKGVLVLTAHIGNWELLAASISLSGFNTSMVVKAARQEWVEKFITRQRENKNIILFHGKNSIRDILKQLKSGGIVGIVLDQHGIGRDSVIVPFFGRHASTLKALSLLSLRTEAPVVPIYIYRDEHNHHHIMISPPIEHTDDSDEGRTRQYTEWLESAIRAHPDQWIWTHNRWKISP